MRQSSHSRPLIAWLMICSLMASAVFFETPTAKSCTDSQASVLSHPCPDSAPSGAPCHDNCPCLCCPGHRYSGALHDPVAASVPDQQHELLIIIDRPVLQDHAPGVFRPPRSAQT